MLELGKYSKKLHKKAADFINQTKIDKVYVYWKDVVKHLTKLEHKKEEKILNSKKDIFKFYKK